MTLKGALHMFMADNKISLLQISKEIDCNYQYLSRAVCTGKMGPRTAYMLDQYCKKNNIEYKKESCQSEKKGETP